jgi:hypothetical protein
LSTYWRLQRVEDAKFPYRITLESDGEVTLALRAKDRWPGPQGNVFCLREQEPPEGPVEELEYVPVASLNRFGKKLALTLDRRRQRQWLINSSRGEGDAD